MDKGIRDIGQGFRIVEPAQVIEHTVSRIRAVDSAQFLEQRGIVKLPLFQGLWVELSEEQGYPCQDILCAPVFRHDAQCSEFERQQARVCIDLVNAAIEAVDICLDHDT